MIAEAIDVAVAELRASQVERTTRRNTVAAELAAIGGRERRLLDALAGGDTAAGVIRERLRQELARRDRLTAELADLDAAGVVDTEALLRTVMARAVEPVFGRGHVFASNASRFKLSGSLLLPRD